VPKLLTYQGRMSIWFFGLSAPIIAWIATRGRLGLRLAMGWERAWAAVSRQRSDQRRAHGPLETHQHRGAERGDGDISLHFIPGFLAPLAVTLHVLAIRAIAARLRDTRSPASGLSTSTNNYQKP